MRNATGWRIAALLAQEVAGEKRTPAAPFIVPLADRRRARLIEEKGDAGIEEAAEADREERARLRGGMRARKR